MNTETARQRLAEVDDGVDPEEFVAGLEQWRHDVRRSDPFDR